LAARTTRWLLPYLIAIAVTAYAGPTDDAAQLLKTATYLLGLGDKNDAPADTGQWQAIHAVEGDGLMRHGVPPEVCAEVEAQSARTAARLQTSCHRDGATSTLIVFTAQ
jgi:hypothetical protein